MSGALAEDPEKKRARQRRWKKTAKGRASNARTNARRLITGHTYYGYLGEIKLPHQGEDDGKAD